MEIRLLSSLEKVFRDKEPSAPTHGSVSALRGERVSFQIACYMEDQNHLSIAAQAQTALDVPVELYEVETVPVTLPAYIRRDADYLRVTPGLYPDLLMPHKGRLTLNGGQWRSLWISLVVPTDAAAGPVPIHVRLVCTDDPQTLLGGISFVIDVIPAILPPQKLIHTEWFHCDCLATHYRVPVFSEEHWRLIGCYMKNAVDFGVNMILTPVFTPPLDTAPGEERPTVQLVDVVVRDGVYVFGFDKLERYMRLAEECGIQYFEISHLFTQWGAACAPKIVADIDGQRRRIFGWETDAGSTEYVSFLRTFLTALRGFLSSSGRESRCYFHISDEPGLDMLEGYRRARESVADVLEGLPVIDALSDYTFYEKRVVPHPIPSIDHADTFASHNVNPLWTYYCCAQGVDVSNRFISMPSYRNRVIACQFYKYRIDGFLQWGYNFWYSGNSRESIQPFADTCAHDSFPGGDAFLVYPGEDGVPSPSLRQMVFFEALQDLRAFQLLESFTSYEEVLELIECGCDEKITFHSYPRDAGWLLAVRERINRKIGSICTT